MLKIVKIGGNIVDNPDRLDKFLSDFASLDGGKVLIHGGGKVATTISKSMGLDTKMIDGRRVTDEDTIRIVTMVYAGLINKTIVNKLNALGCRAVGLSGADGELIVSDRRNPEPIDFGFVGDPKKANGSLVELLTSGGYTVVVAPITTDGQGTLLNTNADTVAQTVAVAMAKADREQQVELVYCFEKAGVLMDVDNDDSVIEHIDKKTYKELKAEGVVADGMLPKLHNAFEALDSGVASVVICGADAITQKGYGGTVITL